MRRSLGTVVDLLWHFVVTNKRTSRRTTLSPLYPRELTFGSVAATDVNYAADRCSMGCLEMISENP